MPSLFLLYNTYTGARAFLFAFFGEGNGPIYLDDVACTGTESRLLSCLYNRVHSCSHGEDAGVRCQGCATGDLRLVGGNNDYEGRVEVCRENIWGTVCDNSWDMMDANVACRQAGFSGFGATPRLAAFYEAGQGSIYLSNVGCNGNETTLFSCASDTMNQCIHSEDAGVTCNPTRKLLATLATNSTNT